MSAQNHSNTLAAETSSRNNPFSPKALLAILIVGSLAFLLLLFAIGAGWDGTQERDGQAHAGSNGLSGYAGLVSLLKARGHDVSLSRNSGVMDEEVLLILTPPQFTDSEDLSRQISDRRYIGPTLVILPKWTAARLPDNDEIEAEAGWVHLSGTRLPQWFNDLEYLDYAAILQGKTNGWTGLGLSGSLPEPDNMQAVSQHSSQESLASDEDETIDAIAEAIADVDVDVEDHDANNEDGDDTNLPSVDPLDGLIIGDTDNGLIPMVRDSEGDILVGYRDDGGYFPDLAYDAGKVFSADQEGDQEEGAWPIVYVIEPDLMNNYGMADLKRAQLAEQIILSTLEDYDMPLVFDLTLNGLGKSKNLLTLAFQPPFLAATICLLFAALVILWRSFARFGPPLAEVSGFAKGKTALARNGATLVERAKRLHLLGPPFADMVTVRITKDLGIHSHDADERDAAIDTALAKTDYSGPTFTSSAQILRKAKKPQELLRAARALRTIERTLEQ